MPEPWPDYDEQSANQVRRACRDFEVARRNQIPDLPDPDPLLVRRYRNRVVAKMIEVIDYENQGLQRSEVIVFAASLLAACDEVTNRWEQAQGIAATNRWEIVTNRWNEFYSAEALDDDGGTMTGTLNPCDA